jgi:hypothetical protein
VDIYIYHPMKKEKEKDICEMMLVLNWFKPNAQGAVGAAPYCRSRFADGGCDACSCCRRQCYRVLKKEKEKKNNKKEESIELV